MDILCIKPIKCNTPPLATLTGYPQPRSVYLEDRPW